MAEENQPAFPPPYPRPRPTKPEEERDIDYALEETRRLTSEANTFLSLSLAAYVPQGGAMFALLANPSPETPLWFLMAFAAVSDAIVLIFALCALSRYERVELISKTWGLWAPIDEVLGRSRENPAFRVMRGWFHAEERFLLVAETPTGFVAWLGARREWLYLIGIGAILAITGGVLVSRGWGHGWPW